MFPVPWSSKWNWSLHLFLGRPMFLRPFGLYCNACFGNLFVSILCTCCSHFSWYCFIFFTVLWLTYFKGKILKETLWYQHMLLLKIWFEPGSVKWKPWFSVSTHAERKVQNHTLFINNIDDDNMQQIIMKNKQQILMPSFIRYTSTSDFIRI